MPDELKTFEVELEDGSKMEAVSRADLEAAQQRATDLEAQLAAEKDKEKNFKAVRTAKEEVEAEKEELKSRLAAIEGKFKEGEETTQKQIQAELDEFLTQESGGDEEKKKLLKFHYEEFAGTPATKQERLERVLKAKRLAFVDESADPIARAASAQGSGFIKERKTDFAETEKGKTVADKLGLKIESKK